MAKRQLTTSPLLTAEQTLELDERVGKYVDGCQQLITNHYVKRQFDLVPPRLDGIKGQRYIRVVSTPRVPVNYGKSVEIVDGPGTMVHSFIDITTGDVLKAAGWKSPAKHARGNVFDEHNGLGSMSAYGPAHLT